MRNKKHTLLIFGLVTCLLLTLVGCAEKEITKSKTNIILEQIEYLNGKGYNISKSKGIIDSYVLEKELLSKQLYSNIWGLQDIEIQTYFGKPIDVYSYIVNNHKLDTLGDMDGTLVWLIVCENKIVGGYSLPNNSETLYGGVYSIDGLTLEEVTGMDFPTWQKEWQKKYN